MSGLLLSIQLTGQIKRQQPLPPQTAIGLSLLIILFKSLLLNNVYKYLYHIMMFLKGFHKILQL